MYYFVILDLDIEPRLLWTHNIPMHHMPINKMLCLCKKMAMVNKIK